MPTASPMARFEWQASHMRAAFPVVLLPACPLHVGQGFADERLSDAQRLLKPLLDRGPLGHRRRRPDTHGVRALLVAGQLDAMLRVALDREGQQLGLRFRLDDPDLDGFALRELMRRPPVPSVDQDVVLVDLDGGQRVDLFGVLPDNRVPRFETWVKVRLVVNVGDRHGLRLRHLPALRTPTSRYERVDGRGLVPHAARPEPDRADAPLPDETVERGAADVEPRATPRAR